MNILSEEGIFNNIFLQSQPNQTAILHSSVVYSTEDWIPIPNKCYPALYKPDPLKCSRTDEIASQKQVIVVNRTKPKNVFSNPDFHYLLFLINRKYSSIFCLQKYKQNQVIGLTQI